MHHKIVEVLVNVLWLSCATFSDQHSIQIFTLHSVFSPREKIKHRRGGYKPPTLGLKEKHSNPVLAMGCSLDNLNSTFSFFFLADSLKIFIPSIHPSSIQTFILFRREPIPAPVLKYCHSQSVNIIEILSSLKMNWKHFCRLENRTMVVMHCIISVVHTCTKVQPQK